MAGLRRAHEQADAIKKIIRTREFTRRRRVGMNDETFKQFDLRESWLEKSDRFHGGRIRRRQRTCLQVPAWWSRALDLQVARTMIKELRNPFLSGSGFRPDGISTAQRVGPRRLGPAIV